MKTMLDSMMEAWTQAGMDADLMLESMITQWKAAGMNPEMMLGHLRSTPAPIISQQAAAEYMQAAHDLSNANDFDDIDDTILENPFMEWDGDEVPLTTQSDINDIKDIHAIACGANLALLNRSYLNSLSSLYDGFEKDDVLTLLETDWDITNRSSLLETIQWLADGGHRGYWKRIWQALQDIPRDEWSFSARRVAAELEADGADGDTVADYTENFVEGLGRLNAIDALASQNTMDVLTWDLGRAINLCRWGYDAGFISRDEALTKLRSFAAQLVKQYRSWEEMSMGYILGFVMWNSDEYELNTLLHDHYVLLNQSKSPLVLIDWK